MKSEIILLDSKAYEGLIDEISSIIETSVAQSVTKCLRDLHSDWVKSSVAMKILNIASKTTLKKIRDKHNIKFTKSANGYLYSRSSLLAHLEAESSD